MICGQERTLGYTRNRSPLSLGLMTLLLLESQTYTVCNPEIGIDAALTCNKTGRHPAPNFKPPRNWGEKPKPSYPKPGHPPRWW